MVILASDEAAFIAGANVGINGGTLFLQSLDPLVNQTVATGERPAIRRVFDIAWPLAVKATMLHGIVVIDAYLVSALGETALASLGLAGAIAGLLLGSIFAFSGAAQIRIAQAFGTGTPRRLKSVFLCGQAINAAIAILGLMLILAFAGKLLSAVAQTPEIAQGAGAYLVALAPVFVAEAISQNIGSYFNGCGRTRIPLYSYALALPVNVGISYALIHGEFGLPELGLTGAALGTTLGATLRAVFLGMLLLRTELPVLRAIGWQGDSFPAAMQRHLSFSLPIAVTFLSMGFANHVSMLIYAQMGVIAFAAMTIIIPWIQVAGTISMSWAQATGILVAQLLGRRADGYVLDRFLSSAWRGVFAAAVLVSVLLAGVSLFAARIYPQLQPETADTLRGFLPFLLILPILKNTNAICGNTLRAAGDTVYVMNLFVSAQWLFRVPLVALAVLVLNLPVTWVLGILLLEELVKLPWFHLRILNGGWKTAQVFDD